MIRFASLDPNQANSISLLIIDVPHTSRTIAIHDFAPKYIEQYSSNKALVYMTRLLSEYSKDPI